MYHVQSSPGQLSAHRLPLHQNPLHRQRHSPTFSAQQIPRQRLQPLRRRGPLQLALSAAKRGLRIAAIPARHHVPLPDSLPRRQHPRLRRAMRSAHQSLQREDLHFHLVLAHLRRHRLTLRPTRLALVLVATQSGQLSQKVLETHGSHQSREIRQEVVHAIRGEVFAARWRARLASHWQELKSGDYGRGHVRLVGQLQVKSIR